MKLHSQAKESDMKSRTPKAGLSRYGMFMIASSMVILTAACTSGPNDKDKTNPREVGQLTRVLDMVDKSGKVYGTVELAPVGGGKVYDADGRIIGHIVSQAPE